MSRTSRSPSEEAIVIDEQNGLVFSSEQELYSHFEKEIQGLEKEFFSSRKTEDIAESDFPKYDKNLDKLLDDPDQVWEDSVTMPGHRYFTYVRKFDDGLYHVALCYLTESTPSFVYLHFPTSDEELVNRYRRGQMAFERPPAGVSAGAIDGDALHEGDDLAQGLYSAMLLLRGEKDIPEDDFSLFSAYRELTLEDADEIWRSSDTMGNILVSFIKEFTEDEEEFSYIVVTVEDAPSSSHALLFSFPTRDKSLVERYRHGENLQADEVVQESSH